MAGLFFSRKSKNGVEAPTVPATVAADAQTVYEPLPAPALVDDLPDALPGIPDLYAVLGVDPRASDDIIRYAYRKKAAKLHDARWRPARAARQLAELNAAYEILGKPDRRADYDRQRARLYYYQQAAREFQANGGHLDETDPLAPPRRGASAGRRGRWAPRGLLETIAVIGVVLFALYAGYTVFASGSLGSFRSVQEAGAALGLGAQPRVAPTAPPTPPVAQPTPTPRQVIVPPVVMPTPTAAPPAVAPTAPPAPTAKPEGNGIRTTVRVSNPAPPRRSDIHITVRLTRDNRPLSGVPVYLTAYYRTVEERFPTGGATEPTNANGEATISFNVGDATPNHPVEVVVTATVDGEPVQIQTSFTPR